MRQGWKRTLAGMLAGAVCAGALPGVPLMAEETEAARGRYLESDAALPEGLFVRDIERMEDGSLAVIGETQEKYAVYKSTDGGASWEEQYALDCAEETASAFWADVRLSPTGGGAAVVMKEQGEAQQGEAFDMEISLLTFDDSGAVQEKVVEDGDLRLLEYTGQGELIGLTYNNGAALIDPSTGEHTVEMVSEFVNAFGVCGEEVLLLLDEEVQRYDLHTGEPLARDEALNEALYTGSHAKPEGYMQTTTTGSPILFSQDEEGRLYYCMDQGIFSHMMDGNVVEQVIDGSLVSLSAPNVSLLAMAVLGETFYVLESEDGATTKLLKYEYDPDISSVPERELTVYSLMENQQIRQAIVGFQKKYPDTYINYQTGMSGEDGVTVADALRTLNTDILAGNGPDVLLLDGMSVETYASQGVLMDLSEVVAEAAKSEGLLENITDAYRTEEGLVAVPARFSMEVITGLTQNNKVDATFESLEALASQQGVLDAFDIVNLPEILYPVCAGSWENEDHTINQEKLAEFVNGVKAVSGAYRAAASEETLERMSKYENGEFSAWSDLFYPEIDLVQLGLLDLLGGGTQLKLGSLGSIISYAGILSVESEAGACQVQPLAMQQENVFYPSVILSILNTTKEQERAGQFVAYMLSADAQNEIQELGFPVNKTSFDNLLSENQFEDGAYGLTSSDSDGNMVELMYEWPSQEEMDALRKMAESLTTCADTAQIKKDTVITEVKRCMSGEISADEAVNSIMQKLNLYLAE